MEFLIVIIIIIGGLLFIYFNMKVICKFNITAYFANIDFNIVIFKKNTNIMKKYDYSVIVKKILSKESNRQTFERYNHYLHYLKYTRYPMKIFIIKNIYIYEECFEDKVSIAVEFFIVNKILKRSLLNN